MGATSPDDEPDLIQVETDSGVRGYILKTDLHAADGTYDRDPSSAAGRREARGSASPHPLKVYAQDGTTVIGVWYIG